MTQVLLLVIVVAGAVAAHAWRRAEALAGELERERGSLRDVDTGLLTVSAMATTMQPELAWARQRSTHATLLRLDVHALDLRGAARRLAAGVRREEHAVRLDDGSFAVLLLDTDAQRARIATARLVEAVRSEAVRVVDAGWATFPEDGAEVTELLAAASSRLAPHAWRRRSVDGSASAAPTPAP